MLPPVKSLIRTALLNLSEYKDLSTEQLKQMARQLPGGGRMHFPDRVASAGKHRAALVHVPMRS